MGDNKKYETLDSLFDLENNNLKIDENGKTEIIRRYQEKFGHAIPYYLLPETVTEEEVFEKVKSCLESGEDNIVELFGIQIDEDAVF